MSVELKCDQINCLVAQSAEVRKRASELLGAKMRLNHSLQFGNHRDTIRHCEARVE